MIEIDGSHEEGGGQILRNSLALSTITKEPFILGNIRVNRPEPGLKQQHLMAIKAIGEITGARYEGAFPGSTEIKFWPGKVLPGKFAIDIGTAGSITLLLQAIILPIAESKLKVNLRVTGGTDVLWSQPWDHFEQILLPYIQRQCSLDAKLLKRGYYPKGGGLVELNFSEKKYIEPIAALIRGRLQSIKGVSHASKELSKSKVAERQAESAKQSLSSLGIPIEITIAYSDSFSVGSGLTLAAFCQEGVVLGASSLGERSKRAEDIGKEAALSLKKILDSGSPVDYFLADQLPIFLKPKDKMLVPELSGHLKSALYVCEKFGRKIKVNGLEITAL